MSTVVEDPVVERSLIEERRRNGLDRYDEVWEGVYIIMPSPNDEHQDLVAGTVGVLRQTIQKPGLGKVRLGINVSDRVVDWKTNFRIPDAMVYLNDNPAQCYDTSWYGGPDFAIEVASPGDRSRLKLGFYASVGTRELLLIDRDPWNMWLYRS